MDDRPRTRSLLRWITAILILAILAAAPLGYRALYRRLEWKPWFDPQPFAGAETGHQVRLYVNRFTNERAAYLFAPDGELLLARVRFVHAPARGRIQVDSEDGAPIFLDDPPLVAAVEANAPQGFMFGFPVERSRFFRYWPRLETSYDSLPLPVE